MIQNNLQRLSARLNYNFNNSELLKHALTHRSADSRNNERLEFLGDSLLNMIIANALFELFPELSEGELSRLRAYLVKAERLTEIANELNLGDYLYLGQGELKSGGFRRASILADALEAICAAVFLDSNFTTCQQFILQLYQDKLNDNSLINCTKDPKTQLQEYLQANKHDLPKYILTKIKGTDNNQIFYITCEVSSLKKSAQGHGASRRQAEQGAAKKLLELLQNCQ